MKGVYEEGERQEGGTCSGRKLGELGRAGQQAGMGRKMGRDGKGGLEEEASVRKAVPWHGTAVRREGRIFGWKCRAGLRDHATRKMALMRIPARARTTGSGNGHVAGGVRRRGGGGKPCVKEQWSRKGTVAHKYKLLYFTLNISGLRSDFPCLHTEIPCLLRQFLAFAVTLLNCTVNSLVCTLQ